MLLDEYILTEEYQDLYSYKSLFRTKEILKNGFIGKSQGGPRAEKYGSHICLTRNKQYQRLNSPEVENIGSIQEIPGNFAASFVLDGNKLRTKYKMTKYKSNRFENKNDENIYPRTRYEAEERVLTDKIPLSFVKKIIIDKKVNKKSIVELTEMAKKYNIPVEVGEI